MALWSGNFTTFSSVSNPSSTIPTPWSNPSNAQTTNGIFATANVPSLNNEITDFLRCLNPGTAPADFAGGVPLGIKIYINRKADQNGFLDFAQDDTVILLKASATSGNNKASVTTYTTSLVEVSYGGVADLWGTTWTDTQINNAGWGIQLACSIGAQSAPSVTVSVDQIRFEVTYTPGGTKQLASSGCGT